MFTVDSVLVPPTRLREYMYEIDPLYTLNDCEMVGPALVVSDCSKEYTYALPHQLCILKITAQ